MPRICKVLVVEDHDSVRMLLGDIFYDEGYRFRLAADGEEMRAALEEEAFDIVIIDLALSGEDGFQLAAEAAEHGCGVVLTDGTPRDSKRLREGGYRFMKKPFMAADLLHLVDEVMKETEARCIRRKPPARAPFRS